MSARASAASLLQIDAAEAVRRIEDFIRRVAGRAGGQVILGVSGGIDSALVAALAARALGHGRLHLLHLKGPDTSAADKRRVRLLAAGETQFISGLRQGDFRGHRRAGMLFSLFFAARKDAAYAQHVLRRTILERAAAAPNRSAPKSSLHSPCPALP
jgi:asparagine synthetase B (glutamine-hydrolysing)